MAEFACKSRVLIENGRWLVPAADRPANWRSILDAENDVVVTAMATATATAAEASTDAEILTAAVEAADNPAMSVSVDPQQVCTVEWCTDPMGSIRFTSEDDECVVGLCEKHSAMSALFCCDGKSPKEVAERYGATQRDVIEAVRVEMLGLWLEHNVKSRS